MGQRKILTGRVISNKMRQTVLVEVQRLQRHPVYGKVMRQTTRLMAHDQDAACQVGDLVRVIETRPLSKWKRWAVIKILRQEGHDSGSDQVESGG
jgi:small subunit ribosomal protein S17